jgi:hypothetical protein
MLTKMSGSFLDTIIAILIEFGVPWQPWMAKLLPIPVFLLMLPFFLRNIRISQARKLLKRSNVFFREERREMEKNAINKVKDIPTAMLGLADEAIKMQRYELAQELIGYVPASNKYRRELVRIHQKINPSALRTKETEILAIERLLENNLFESAQQRIKEAKKRWPDYKGIHDLEAHLQQKKHTIEESG